MITVTNCTTGEQMKLPPIRLMRTKTRTIRKRKIWWQPYTWITRYYKKSYKVSDGYGVLVPGSIAKFGEVCTAHYETDWSAFE